MRYLPHSKSGLLSSKPEVPVRYRFGEDDKFEIDVASSIPKRREAWRLVYNAYKAKGYASSNPDSLWYGIHDAIPSTTTLIARQKHCAISTVSIVFDSPLDLPASELFSDITAQMREEGRRPAEIVSLACREMGRRDNYLVLLHLFKLAYMTARYEEKATDLIITVNPKHVSYYEKKLLFKRVGPVRNYAKVAGAPAVFMCLDLLTAENHYMEVHGSQPGSLGYHFCHPKAQYEAIGFLRRHRYPLGFEEIYEYFCERRQVLNPYNPVHNSIMPRDKTTADIRFIQNSATLCPAVCALEPAFIN